MLSSRLSLMKSDKAMKCATCRRGMKQGDEAWKVEEGIVGMSDFVGLADAEVFCSLECLGRYLSPAGGYEKVGRRVP